eukprot:g1044.t1
MQAGPYLCHVESVAGVNTCVSVRRGRKFHVVFDMGSCPKWAMGANTVFISHSHIDHIGAIFKHARSKGLQKQRGKNIPTYFVPKEAMEGILKAKEAFEMLDSLGDSFESEEKGKKGEKDKSAEKSSTKKFQMHFVPVEAGKSYSMPAFPNFTIYTFRTKHRVPSVGYCLVEKKKGPLIDELRGADGSTIREWVKAHPGKTANTEIRTEEIVYTGDTQTSALFEKDVRRQIFNAKLMIMEMTFCDSAVTPKRAEELGHVHLEDVRRELECDPKLFDRVDTLILMHFSPRYKGSEIVEAVRSALLQDVRYIPWYKIDRDDAEGYRLFYAAIFSDVLLSAIVFYVTPLCVPSVNNMEGREKSKFLSNLAQIITLLMYFPLASGYFPDVGVEFLCGILVGYEIWGLIGELLAVHGRVRPEFLGHHLACVAIGYLSYIYFYSIPLVERQFWWFAYDTLTVMFISNVVLLMRNMQKKKTLFWNASFALSFFYCRFYLQYLSVAKFQALYGTITSMHELPWTYRSTSLLYAMWLGFSCLNLYWGFLILRMAFCKRSKKLTKDA